MEFASVQEVKNFLLYLKLIGSSLQGECYLRNGKVFKFFNGYDEGEDLEISEEQIMQFKGIDSELFIFPLDVIKLKEMLIGYITKYVKALDLCGVNPLTVNLDFLIRVVEEALKDLKIASDNGVWTYDMMYNIMLGKRLYVVDPVEYSKKDIDPKLILEHNVHYFNESIMLFLVDDIFDDVIKDNSLLSNMYQTNGQDISVIEFIKVFRDYLSELVGKRINNLGEARKLINKKYKKKPEYIRTLL